MQNNTFSQLIIGQKTIYLDRVASTNDYLKENLSKFKPQDEGTAILAGHQYAGRGQRQNVWIAEPGKNLTLSVLLYPKHIPIQNQFDLSAAVALACMHFVQKHCSQEVRIKWPNDIYVQDKKIGGILIENKIKNTGIAASIVGIGLNINQSNFTDNSKSSSLKVLNSQEDYNLKVLASELFEQLTFFYHLTQKDPQKIRDLFNLNLYWHSQWHNFEDATGIFEGKIEAVNESGALIIQDKALELRTFYPKEVKFVR